MRIPLGLATIALVLASSPYLESVAEDEPGLPLSVEATLSALRNKSGEELHGYLTRLDRDLGKSALSDTEIDSILRELRRIKAGDPFSKYVEFKGPKRLVYPNRMTAKECVFRFRFQKIVNGLRRMPIDRRVAAILAYMVRSPIPGYSTDHLLANELVVAGTESVPYILQQRFNDPGFHVSIARALARIGDPRGIDYIVGILHTNDYTSSIARAEAAKLLGSFKEERVVDVLIEALHDQNYERCDRSMRAQIVSISNQQAYIGRYYNVQHAAATSLSGITGMDWGLLYNEDYKTWKSWRDSTNRELFSPCKVPRNEEELGKLIEFLYHRYMSARPNPYQPQNDLKTDSGIEAIAKDLECLETGVVPILLKKCRERIRESPAWSEELREWTRKLLLPLPWPEAGQATIGLSQESTGEYGGKSNVSK